MAFNPYEPPPGEAPPRGGSSSGAIVATVVGLSLAGLFGVVLLVAMVGAAVRPSPEAPPWWLERSPEALPSGYVRLPTDQRGPSFAIPVADGWRPETSLPGERRPRVALAGQRARVEVDSRTDVPREVEDLLASALAARRAVPAGRSRSLVVGTDLALLQHVTRGDADEWLCVFYSGGARWTVVASGPDARADTPPGMLTTVLDGWRW